MKKRTRYFILIAALALCFTLAASCASPAPAPAQPSTPAPVPAPVQPSTPAVPTPAQPSTPAPEPVPAQPSTSTQEPVTAQPSTPTQEPATAQPSTPAPVPTPAQSSAPAPQRRQDIIIDGARTYTVVSRDTLSRISRRFYGNGFYFPVIMLASSNIIRDPDRIRPGMRLTIPNLQVNLNDSRARARIKSFLREIAVINERRNRPLDAYGLRRLANSL